MRVRTAAAIGLVALVAAAPAEAATKKKKKPITQTYTVQAVPYPNPAATQSCDEVPAQAVNQRMLTVTGPGKLTVEVSGFTGDWDVAVFSSTGAFLSEGSGTAADDVPPNTDGKTEKLSYKSRKAQKLRVDVCNFLGSPNATVKLVYTYA
jgi:hypothetical protein